MPECPHCHGYYFGNPDQCPKCSYDFVLKKVVSKYEAEELRTQRQLDEEEYRQKEEELRHQQEQKAHKNRIRALEYNALYEYTTVYLSDSRSGILDKKSLDDTLQQYAAQGWKLHSIITNETGKNSSSLSIGGITAGSNATIEITILIFERCIKLPGQ